MSFIIKDDDAFYKYNEIWNKIRKTLNIKKITCLFMMKNT